MKFLPVKVLIIAKLTLWNGVHLEKLVFDQLLSNGLS